MLSKLCIVSFSILSGNSFFYFETLPEVILSLGAIEALDCLCLAISGYFLGELFKAFLLF